MISVAEYFNGSERSRTPELNANAEALLDKANALRAEAEGEGVARKTDPDTGTEISGAKGGSGAGGFRPQDSKTGAPNSAHKTAHAVDVFDPDRRFAAWCLAHLDRVREHGLYIEDPRWTPGWVHLQDVPPKSGKLCYVPSTAPALAGWPPEWIA